MPADDFSQTVIKIITTILVTVLLHLIVRALIARIIRQAVRSHHYENKIDEEKRENTLISMLRTATAVLLWVIAVIVILSQLNIDLATLATGAGLIGIIVAFGTQDAIKDFLGGMFIILENQYRVGDIVTLRGEGGDVSGLVEDITIRITRLRDLDGNLHIVQNGSINIVTNRSFDFANVNVDVSVAYESDITAVERVMNTVGQAMADDEVWSDRIAEPIKFLRVDGFEDSGVRIKALGKVEPAMQWEIAGEFRRRLLVAFEKEGITIPFPQIVVHTSK